MSTVITTMIILIASVVLGAGTILFGGNLFQSNSQGDSMQVSNVNTWVAGNGTNSVTAFAITNTGGRPISISAINFRGLSVPYGNWFYNTQNATATNIASAIPYTDLKTANLWPTNTTPPGNAPVGGDGSRLYFTTTTGPVTLAQGKAMIVYLTNAGKVQSLDMGNTFTMNVLGGQANAAQMVTVQKGPW
jgi:hypothetical protein